MKLKTKISIILLTMFVIAQFIGFFVLNANPFYFEQQINGTIEQTENPYSSWIIPPEVETQGESFSMLGSLIFAFIIAISLLLFLSKFKIEFLLRAWFFLVVVIALFLSILALEKILGLQLSLATSTLIAFLISLALAYISVFGKGFIIKNIIIIFVYAGVATIFVPIFNIWTMGIFLILISIYDLWAVWHSGIMQKMAKYQINKIGIFPGFIIPHASKKVKAQIAKIKALSKKQRAKLKDKKFKINIAVLGGGDIVFPLITAGVIMKTFGLGSALFVTAGATCGLIYLFFFAKKRKAYPAMPFITAGMFIAIALSQVIL